VQFDADNFVQLGRHRNSSLDVRLVRGVTGCEDLRAARPKCTAAEVMKPMLEWRCSSLYQAARSRTLPRTVCRNLRLQRSYCRTASDPCDRPPPGYPFQISTHLRWEPLQRRILNHWC